jgi:heat shock protein HslJ
MKKIILCHVVLLSIVACTTVKNTGDTKPKAQASLENTHWTLAEQVKGKTPTIAIETEKINGTGGCNNYFGTVNWNKELGTFSL